MVEPQPSKLMMAVRSRSSAPGIVNGIVNLRNLGTTVDQLDGTAVFTGYAKEKACPYSSVVEHFLGKEEVTGSTPVMGSKNGPEIGRNCLNYCLKLLRGDELPNNTPML